MFPILSLEKARVGTGDKNPPGFSMTKVISKRRRPLCFYGHCYTLFFLLRGRESFLARRLRVRALHLKSHAPKKERSVRREGGIWSLARRNENATSRFCCERSPLLARAYSVSVWGLSRSLQQNHIEQIENRTIEQKSMEQGLINLIDD